MTRAATSEDLDQLAAAVFGGEDGKERLAPLLSRFDLAVMPLYEDDRDFERLQTFRIDWALCEATSHGDSLELDHTRLGVGSPCSWAWRVAFGHELGTAAGLRGQADRVARSFVGLFEVWPGRTTWLRDRIGGLCLKLLDDPGPLSAVRTGPAALWALRVAFDGDRGVRLCRGAIDFPLELVGLLEDQHSLRFSRPAWPSLLELVRARVVWARSRRPGAFALTLVGDGRDRGLR